MQKSKKLIISIVAIIVIVVGCVFATKGFSSKADGSIEVVLVDLDGKTVKDETIEFNEGDALVDLLSENFDNVEVTDGMLMTIDEFTTPEDWSTFIAILVDDQMSDVGILDIQYKDGTKITFEMTEMNW